jgi:hypothetical protein
VTLLQLQLYNFDFTFNMNQDFYFYYDLNSNFVMNFDSNDLDFVLNYVTIFRYKKLKYTCKSQIY